MKISKKTQEQAFELFEKLEVDELIVNEKGEFFTHKNQSLALLSVKNDTKKIVTIKRTEGLVSENTQQDDKKPGESRSVAKTSGNDKKKGKPAEKTSDEDKTKKEPVLEGEGKPSEKPQEPKSGNDKKDK